MTEQTGTADTEPNFAENIRFYRESRGWSQTEFANQLQAAGLSTFHQTTVSRLEKGERPIRLGEARVIALVLDQRVNALWNPPAESSLARDLEEDTRAFDAACRSVSSSIEGWESTRSILRHTIDYAMSEHGQVPNLDAAEDTVPRRLAHAQLRLNQTLALLVDETLRRLYGDPEE